MRALLNLQEPPMIDLALRCLVVINSVLFFAWLWYVIFRDTRAPRKVPDSSSDASGVVSSQVVDQVSPRSHF